ncbi:MAG: hypothetical protein ACLGIB_04715 [Actinomycetota bacterium]
MTRPDRDLDRALAGRSDPDEALAGLVETARVLTQAFDVEPEPALRERALFAAGVAARRRSGFPLVRLFAPVAAGLGLLAALGFASGTAMPGDVLYPVRKVLQDVGLNEGLLTEALARMDRAGALLDEAEDLPRTRRERATGLAVRAIQELSPVGDLLEEADLGSEELARHRARLATLIERATSLIAATEEAEGFEGDDGEAGGPDPRERDEREGDDRSGSDDDREDDSDDDDGDGDSGSDDDRDDDSGSGDGGDSDPDDRDDDSTDDDRDDDSGSGSDGDDRSDPDEREDDSGSDEDPIDSLEDERDDESDVDGEDRLD